MRLHSTTITILALAALCAVAAPALAAESPLLSGYGGPGAGEQQIVSSGLVGGRGGGGGAGTSSGGAGAEGTPSEYSGSQTSTSSGSGSGSGSGTGTEPGAGRSKSDSTAKGSSGDSSKPNTGGKGTSSGPAGPSGGTSRIGGAAEAAAVEQPVALGLSGSQLLTSGLIAAALVLGALATWWLGALQRRREDADRNHMRSGV